MVSVTVEVRVHAGARAQFVSDAGSIAAISVAERGCQRFDVVAVVGDQHRFVISGLFDDEAALGRHRASPQQSRWQQVLDSCVSEHKATVGHVVSPHSDDALGTPAVVRQADAPTVDRGGGVSTAYLVIEAMGASAFMIGTTDFAVGASLPLHSHDCQESVVVIRGTALFESEEGTVRLSVGDATLVPARAAHRFVNGGADSLRILWIYGRANPSRTFQETGETIRIGPRAPSR